MDVVLLEKATAGTDAQLDQEETRGMRDRDAVVVWDWGAFPGQGLAADTLVGDLRAALTAFTSGGSITVKAFLDYAEGLKSDREILRKLQREARVQMIDCPAEEGDAQHAIELECFATALERQPPLIFAFLTKEGAFSKVAAVLRNRGYKVVFLTLCDGAFILPTPTPSVSSESAYSSELHTPSRSGSLYSLSHTRDSVILASPSTSTGLFSLDDHSQISRLDHRGRALEKTASNDTVKAAIAVPLPSSSESSYGSEASSIVFESTDGEVEESNVAEEAEPVEPPFEPLSGPLATEFLGRKSLVYRLADAALEAGTLLSLLLLNKRIRRLLEPRIYERISLHTVTGLLRFKHANERLLGCLRGLELDLPDDAVVRLLKGCPPTLTSITLIRGNWSLDEPPSTLRASLARFPRLADLSLISLDAATVSLPWLLFDEPHARLPLFSLRKLSIERLRGRPRPMFGVQQPLPFTTASAAAVFPMLEVMKLDDVRCVDGEELARLLMVSPRLGKVVMAGCDIEPASLLGAVTEARARQDPFTPSSDGWSTLIEPVKPCIVVRHPESWTSSRAVAFLRASLQAKGVALDYDKTETTQHVV